MKVLHCFTILTYGMPPLFYRGKLTHYGICREFGCWLTLSEEMVRRLFAIALARSRRLWVTNYVLGSIFLGERKRLDGERIGLKLSGFMIAY